MNVSDQRRNVRGAVFLRKGRHLMRYAVGDDIFDVPIAHLHIVKIEQPITHIDLSSELTSAEKSRGVRIVSHRKRVPAKDAGRKLYEVAVFDLRSRKYITDE